MTDNPRKHQYGDADWEYEVDSSQRQGVTGQTLERRHGKVSYPEATNGKKPNNQHDEGDPAFDEDGIPTGI